MGLMEPLHVLPRAVDENGGLLTSLNRTHAKRIQFRKHSSVRLIDLD